MPPPTFIVIFSHPPEFKMCMALEFVVHNQAKDPGLRQGAANASWRIIWLFKIVELIR